MGVVLSLQTSLAITDYLSFGVSIYKNVNDVNELPNTNHKIRKRVCGCVREVRLSFTQVCNG